MKSLVEFINEGSSAVNNFVKMINDFIMNKNVPSKQDIIVSAKHIVSLDDSVRTLKIGSKYVYTEFDNNELVKVAVIDPDSEHAELSNGIETKILNDDNFIDEFGYLISGSDKGLDMRIWRDSTSEVVDNIKF